MTLQELLNEVSSYVDDTDVNNDETIKTRTISALNRAYRRICREKYHLNTEETKVLDDTLIIDLSTLSKKFIIINAVYDINGNELPFDYKNTKKAYIPYGRSGDNVTVNYSYMPDELVNMNDEPLLPAEDVDHRILCYFAAYQHFIIEGDDSNQAAYWLNMWNDGFSSIQVNKVNQVEIKDVYRWW